VKVTKDKYTTHNYNELDGYIWERQIHNRNFYISEKDSEFKLLFSRICRGNEKRINSLMSANGYLLHGYKDPANAKAIIFMDEKPDDGANGGSGKSLLGIAISKIRSSLRLTGKNFKFEQFSFQSYEPGTNIIEFNDLSQNFQFEKLFTTITDNMMIEKKYKDQLIIPFEHSPKILLSTNYTIKGIGESSLRRQFIVEFSDHYNINHFPEYEFGRRFFEDWNEEDWNNFDNFMIGCLQYYLNNGLVEYERINLNMKNLVANTAEEFIDFMEEIKLGEWQNKKIIHQKFVEAYPHFSKNFHQKTFTSWIKTYAKLNGMKYMDKKSGDERSFILSKIENGRMDEH